MLDDGSNILIDIKSISAVVAVNMKPFYLIKNHFCEEDEGYIAYFEEEVISR